MWLHLHPLLGAFRVLERWWMGAILFRAADSHDDSLTESRLHLPTCPQTGNHLRNSHIHTQLQRCIVIHTNSTQPHTVRYNKHQFSQKHKTRSSKDTHIYKSAHLYTPSLPSAKSTQPQRCTLIHTEFSFSELHTKWDTTNINYPNTKTSSTKDTHTHKHTHTHQV